MLSSELMFSLHSFQQALSKGFHSWGLTQRKKWLSTFLSQGQKRNKQTTIKISHAMYNIHSFLSWLVWHMGIPSKHLHYILAAYSNAGLNVLFCCVFCCVFLFFVFCFFKFWIPYKFPRFILLWRRYNAWEFFVIFSFNESCKQLFHNTVCKARTIKWLQMCQMMQENHETLPNE